MRQSILVLCLIVCGVVGRSARAEAGCTPDLFNGTYDTNFGQLDLKWDTKSGQVKGAYHYGQSNRVLAFGTLTGTSENKANVAVGGCKLVLTATWTEDRRLPGGKTQTATGVVAFGLEGTHLNGVWEDSKTKERGGWSGHRR